MDLQHDNGSRTCPHCENRVIPTAYEFSHGTELVCPVCRNVILLLDE